MKKILLISLLITALGVPIAAGQTYRLVSQGSSSPAYPYTTWDTAGHTIQSVIDACIAGDTVLVDNGLYVENVVINEDITLESWCREPADCIISAPVSSPNASVTIADPTMFSGQVIIRGFKIIEGAAGLYLENFMTCGSVCPLITGCIFEGHPDTAFWAVSARFTLEYCTFVDCNTGAFAASTSPQSVVQRNIFAHCTTYGLRVAASGLYMLNNCFYDNGEHIFGGTVSICDEWSGLPFQIGVDPQFVDYVGGDYHLAPISPCIDFINPDDPVTCTMAGQYDQNESAADLGAYGGYGAAPTYPYINCGLRLPESGAQHVAEDAFVSFRIGDEPAGIDLSTLQITISDHGYAPEIFTEIDCTISEVEFFGPPNTFCSDYGYDVVLPGSAHGLFSDFAHVTVTVDVDDNSPVPNSLQHIWQFHADDLNPPVMLGDHNPSQGGTLAMFSPLEIGFIDDGIGVDHESLVLTMNGNPISLNLAEVEWMGDRVTVYPVPQFLEDGANSLDVSLADYYGNQISPVETINFTVNADSDLPFVSGVTSPSVPPPYPAICQFPVPEPGATNVNFAAPIEFTLQDFGNILDLTQMQVRVQSSNGGDWRFYFSAQSTGYVFTSSGDPYCRRIRCVRFGGWGGNDLITVTVTDGRDIAATPNVMNVAVYSFETGLAAIPAMTTLGILLLLLSFGMVMFRRKSRSP